MKKKEFMNKVWDMVKNTPIEKVAEMRTDVVKIGRKYKCLCPFHADDKIGSFVLGGNINIYKCFSCGATGDTIGFIAKHDDCTREEAMLEIALDFGYITEDQKEELEEEEEKGKMEFKEGYDENFARFEESETNDIADIEVLNNVFSVFSKGNELLPEKGMKLSDKHLSYLKEQRFLSDEEIERAGFFTFPSQMIIKGFYEELYQKFGYTPTILEKVPGFFALDYALDTSIFSFHNEEMEDIKPFLFNEQEGIAIPIRDEKGNIQGIQIRLEEKTRSGLRYIWFSSANEAKEKGKLFGTGSGAPKDVVYPDVIKNQTIFITEGKFKAMAIAKTFGSVALSVQGVSTWRGVEGIIDGIKEEKKMAFRNVIVAFDSDIAFNEGVIAQTMKMTEHIKATLSLKTHVALWNVDLGKGIDDLIFNGYVLELKRMRSTEFDHKMKPFIKEVETRWEKGKAPKKEMKELFKKMVLNQCSNKSKKMKKVVA